MKITKRETIQVGTFEVNTTILTINDRAWIVDPGSEGERIITYLERLALKPERILLTHAHFDHIGAINTLQTHFPSLPVYVGEKDIPVLTHPLNQLPPDYPPIELPKNLVALKDGTPPEELADIEIIATPGHTPGGVCYYFPGALLLSGDTLFAGSIGRTDLPGGNMATLMCSLERLKQLPPDTIVIPGHGTFTTIARELAGNPFLQ